MIRKFTNIKVGVELDSLLSRESLFFGERYKAISNCEYLLNLISIWSEQTDDGWAGIHSKRLKSLFRGHKLKYTEVLIVLEKLKIIAPPELNEKFDFKKEKRINKLTFSGKRKISMNIESLNRLAWGHHFSLTFVKAKLIP